MSASFFFWCCLVLLYAYVSPALAIENSPYGFWKNMGAIDVVKLAIPTLHSKNEKCREHSELYLRELKNFKLWATETKYLLFDATAKFPSGVLQGSTYNLGNFDQCVEVKVPYSTEEFFGKYCLTKFTIKPPEQVHLSRNVDYIHNDYTSYFNISVWEKMAVFSENAAKTPRNEFYLSLCLPSSCTNEDLENSLLSLINEFNYINDFNITVEVEERSCQVYEKLQFSTGDIIFLIIILAFVVMVIASSLYSMTTKTSNTYTSGIFNKIILCFSIPNNVKKLMAKSKREDGLDCVCGMKSLSMFLIILGHRCMFTFGSPVANSKFIEEIYTRIEATVLLNGTLVVDTFFLISGFLATYLSLHFFQTKKPNAKIIMIYVHRIIRMLPTYAIVLAFYCTLLVKTGSGPFWQERVGLERERCLQSWWTNILYINNYVNTDKLCMFQSWYLTCDMHYFFFIPPLAWLLQRKPTVGILTIGGLIMLNIVTTFITIYINNESGILLLYAKMLKDPVLSKTFRNFYVGSHLKASPYFVGAIAGYLKYKMKMTGYKIPKHICYTGWVTCLVLVCATVYTGFIFYIPGYSPNIFSAFYAAINHFTFSVSMVWIIIAVSSGNGEWIEPILSWRPFIFLSRITYSTFLIHAVIQMVTSAGMRVPRYASVFNILYDTSGDIVCAYIAGFFLSVFFEGPIIGLEKIIFSKKGVSNGLKKIQKHNILGNLILKQNIKTIT